MSEPRRQLAAIMFTDIIGYTALMGRNEQKALALLKKNKELHEQFIAQYNGKLLKEIGDGILASFSSVSEAVYCAGAIQKGAKEEEISLRIGIHEGEVVFLDNDIFGDGVNIASRIEALATTGEILLSESAYKNIKNKEGIQAEFVNEETLKNVDEPVKIYKVNVDITHTDSSSVKSKPKNKNKIIFASIGGVLIIALAYFFYKYQNKNIVVDQSLDKSIAVLYFDNMSGDPDQEFFSDGMTEELITQLTKIDGIRVTSRQSVLYYKGQAVNSRKIGQDLNVAYLLGGSVRKSGNNLRISVQLIDAVEDKNVWSETFDRQLTMYNVISIQADIARAIAERFNIRITPEINIKIERQPTANLEAYQNYLLARNIHLNRVYHKSDSVAFEQARKYYKLAISEDSLFAEAYAALADLYEDAWLVVSDVDSLIEWYANRAYSIDPDNSFVNAVKSRILIFAGPPLADFRDRWKGYRIDSAYYHLERAYMLSPNDPENYNNIGTLLWAAYGLTTEATWFLERAKEMNPMDVRPYLSLISMYKFQGSFDLARENINKVKDLRGDSLERFDISFEEAFLSGDTLKMKQLIVSQEKKGGRISERERIWLLASLGLLDSALLIMDRYNLRTENNPYSIFNHNHVLYNLYDVFERKDWKDSIFSVYNKQIDVGFNLYQFLTDDPRYAHLHKEPEYSALLEKARKLNDKYREKCKGLLALMSTRER